MQQILAYETDLLEYGDLFDGNPAVANKVAELREGARDELARIDAMGGAIQSIGYMKRQLVEANSARIAGIEAGETAVVGVNRFTGGEPSPFPSGPDAIIVTDPKAESEQVARLVEWRSARDGTAVRNALEALRNAAENGDNIMPPSIAAAKAGVTTGEWGDVVREAFGQYRAPTGVSAGPSNRTESLDLIRDAVDSASRRLGRRLRLHVGKPGLDGHSNGAEQIAARARDCGIEIDYAGIRLTPGEIVAACQAEPPHVLGLSILSGSHIHLMEELMERLREADLAHIPVIVGGIIPSDDACCLLNLGVAKVYTPKDFDLTRIMFDIVELAERPLGDGSPRCRAPAR